MRDRRRRRGSEPAARGRGYRVLVVEDNDDVGQFSTELLEDLGYTVRRVANADAALAILAEDEFSADLVFSDVIMPGMNGVELAGIVRERYPGLPVVLTSGYSNVLAENAHRGFRADPEALFGGAAVANSQESDFRGAPAEMTARGRHAAATAPAAPGPSRPRISLAGRAALNR